METSLLDVVLDVVEGGGFDYALIGAAARNAWAPPRATTDLDLVIALNADTAVELHKRLEEAGLTVRHELRTDPTEKVADIVFAEGEDYTPRKLDLLVAKTPFEQSALLRAVEIDVGGRRCRVITPEDLLVYKLIAGRHRDDLDIRDVVATRRAAGEAIDWAYVEKWASE